MTRLPPLLAALVVLTALFGRVASAAEAGGSSFLADTACPAFQSFRQATNPGDVRTRVGERYAARGLNQAGGDWVRITVPGASPSDRWVARQCGRLDGRGGAEARSSKGGPFRPFFDTRDDGSDDMTPPPPPLTVFDRAMLEVCGSWGSRVSARRFRAALDRPEIATDVGAILTALADVLDRQGASPERLKDRLTTVWFGAEGFQHIFCGEPGEERLGGLHYRGRYLQLQEEELAGRMTPVACLNTEIVPPVYTIGVEYSTPGGRIAGDCPTGYPHDLGARDLLVEATRAYASLARVRGKAMCLHQVESSEGRYMAVLVVERQAIRTFYPDATPACDGGGPIRGCLCEG